MTDIYRELIEMRNSGQAGVLITVIDKKGHGPSVIGKKMLVFLNGLTKGTVGGGDLEYLAVKKAKDLIIEKKHQIKSYNFSNVNLEEDSNNTGMICGGNVTLFFEYIPVPHSVYIFGAGHIGRSLIFHLKNLDYNIIVIDDRNSSVTGFEGVSKVMVGSYPEIINAEKIPEKSYVVIAGYSHETDFEVLRSIYKARWNPGYIGILASPEKGRVIISKLKEEFGGNIDLSRIYSPIGLDIGGESPEEIAISIIAEIQSLRYDKNRNKHLSEQWSVLFDSN